MSLFAELRRRNVVRVGIAYAVVAWILAQIAEFAFENFGAPDWVLKTVVVVLLLGMPLALFFAWAFEITPEGVKREEDVDRSKSITQSTGRKLDFAIIAALAVALVYFVWERQAVDAPPDTAEQTPIAERTEPSERGEPAESINNGPDAHSIAVLPFVNMSSDQEQEWFSDGLTEEILNSLARTPDLLVAARTSSFKFKNSTEDIPTIAKALGVAHVLEGSVRRGGDQLRVTAQLIRASDGFHLWSQTYDRSPEDVIALQEEVAIEIATALETAMDPEALAKMVSAGTRSVAAYNAYLQGLAYGVSTLSTGDAYTFLSARDAFEQAIELDPEFALAYRRLAGFWSIQLQTTNIVSGIVEMSNEEMSAKYDDAIDKSIQFEDDPVNKLEYRARRAAQYMRLAQALRLNTEYLEQRPNDKRAQLLQLNLYADMSKDEELVAAIVDYQRRDGYDEIVAVNSMTFSLVSDDKPFIREFAYNGMDRFTDGSFVRYQAHRSLLWAGDIDGASQVLRILRSSDMGEESILLASLRQACAENRLSDAARIYDRINRDFPDDTSIVWIGHKIMQQHDRALATLAKLDEEGDLESLGNFLSYAYFDPRPYPNLMNLLETQGVEPREPRDIPYSCRL